MQNLVDGGQREGGLRRECIFGDLPFTCILASGHTRRSITTIYGPKRAFQRKVVPFGGFDDKKLFWGQNSPKT